MWEDWIVACKPHASVGRSEIVKADNRVAAKIPSRSNLGRGRAAERKTTVLRRWNWRAG
jgi:hypothetical protein